MAWFIPLLVSLALNVVAYMLMPKPKTARAEATVQKMDDPTAEAGKPIPVVFGTVTIKSPNLLWFGQKSTSSYEVNA